MLCQVEKKAPGVRQSTQTYVPRRSAHRRSDNVVRKIGNPGLKIFIGHRISGSVACYRDNLKEIRPESENSEEDCKERYLNEIDFRKGFREC